MRIDTFALPTVTKEDVCGKTAVVIDSLRATSSIVTAFENGCKEMIPVVELDEALTVARRLGRENVLLCGERGGQHIKGFDLSNSPLEYKREAVCSKTLVMTTTNGTRAINAAAGADKVLISAFINAGETAKRLLEAGDDVVIICAGSNGKFSMEDVLAAGAIISRLQKLAALSLCDLSIAAQTLYENFADNLHAPMLNVGHYKHLQALGFQHDLDYCMRCDTAAVVPVFANGIISKGE